MRGGSNRRNNRVVEASFTGTGITLITSTRRIAAVTLADGKH